MVALSQACWYALVHSAIAFAWAVEPEAVTVPFSHATPSDAAELPPAPPPLSSEPHAVSESAPARATPPRAASRVPIITGDSPRDSWATGPGIQPGWSRRRARR